MTDFAKVKPISPILPGANGRYFVDHNDQPVFWLGDTQWELFRLFTPETAMPILNDRRAKGFNVILVMLTGVDTERIDPSLQSPFVNLAGERAWVDDDPLQPNERYFQHIDKMICLGEQTGQTFVVGVYHQWHAEIITLQKARAWARWLAERYQNVPNLIWSMYPKATKAFIPVCQEIAAGLQEGDGGKHLISVHPDPSVASSSFLHEAEWLAFNMIQTCVDYDQIYTAVTADYQRVPAKPVVMAEGGYEGLEFDRLQTAKEIRQQAFWTQLAGGHHVYGHNEAWRKPLRWAEWLDSPGSRHLTYFREIITACSAWWNLIPDPSLFVSGAGSGYQINTAARSAAGDWILVYLSGASTVCIRLDAVTAGSNVKLEWINPANMERLPAGIFPTSNIPTLTTPAGWEDAVLFGTAQG